MTDERYHPFANGCQFMDWQENNCCNCTKFSFALDPVTDKTRPPLNEEQLCQIELAIYDGHWGDGSLSADIARRMGYLLPDGSDRALEYGWRCTEFEAVATLRNESNAK